jgi:hypothetical protein
VQAKAEAIQNHVNAYVRNIGKGEAKHRTHEGLKFGGDQEYGRSND